MKVERDNDLEIWIKGYVWVTTRLEDIKVMYSGNVITFKDGGMIVIEAKKEEDELKEE